jgi:hypothetical protein
MLNVVVPGDPIERTKRNYARDCISNSGLALTRTPPNVTVDIPKRMRVSLNLIPKAIFKDGQAFGQCSVPSY